MIFLDISIIIIIILYYYQIAGFATTVAASPIDVVKTRYMNSPAGQYAGAIDCAFRMQRQEGFQAFYKGYVCTNLCAQLELFITIS